MGTARSGHTSLTLPDGRVLVWGGTTGPAVWGGTALEAPPELFDPATGTFSAAAPMGDSTYPGAAVVGLADGRLLLFRDRCDDRWDHPTPAGHHVARVEIYDPASGPYQAAGQLPDCVDTANALPNGEVLVTGFWWDLAAKHDTSGGYTSRGSGADEEMLVGWSALFDPDTGAIHETAPIVTDGPSPTILLPNGNVLFFDRRGASLFR